SDGVDNIEQGTVSGDFITPDLNNNIQEDNIDSDQQIENEDTGGLDTINGVEKEVKGAAGCRELGAISKSGFDTTPAKKGRHNNAISKLKEQGHNYTIINDLVSRYKTDAFKNAATMLPVENNIFIAALKHCAYEMFKKQDPLTLNKNIANKEICFRVQAEKDPRTSVTTCTVNSARLLQQEDAPPAISLTPPPLTPDLAVTKRSLFETPDTTVVVSTSCTKRSLFEPPGDGKSDEKRPALGN
ncbi:hypothetical protein M8C21_000050, partial [Ambrosia artemisiifolia]